MKYRRLHKDELKELEKEFIRFLAAQSITGDDWQLMKISDPAKADALIDQFSDLVFEKVIHNVEYLELKTSKDLKVFYCAPDRISLIGLMVEGSTDFDFTRNPEPDEMMTKIRQSGASLKLYSAEKTYSKDRQLELFEMMENGCKISKGELFTLLLGMVKKDK